MHDMPGMRHFAPATDDVRMTRFTVSFTFTTELRTFCTAGSVLPSSLASAIRLMVDVLAGWLRRSDLTITPAHDR
jgi:hypothetical protein